MNNAKVVVPSGQQIVNVIGELAGVNTQSQQKMP
jgi:hypothetical protein